MKTPQPAAERLGVLLQGMGAVGSTFIAGVLAIRKGFGVPIGSLTQMAHIRLGKRTEDRNPKINEFAPMTSLDGLVFGGWDIFGGDMYDACTTAEVLERHLLDEIKDELQEIKPFDGAFDPQYVKRLNGTHVKSGTRREWADAVRSDIRSFKDKHRLDRCVMINCSSTEVYIESTEVHQSIESFEAALDQDDPRISPAMIYAYASILEGIPYANGTPSLKARSVESRPPLRSLGRIKASISIISLSDKRSTF